LALVTQYPDDNNRSAPVRTEWKEAVGLLLLASLATALVPIAGASLLGHDSDHVWAEVAVLWAVVGLGFLFWFGCRSTKRHRLRIARVLGGLGAVSFVGVWGLAELRGLKWREQAWDEFWPLNSGPPLLWIASWVILGLVFVVRIVRESRVKGTPP
jgi:hypothetical protein